MEWHWRHWYFYRISPILIPLLLTLTIWFARGAISERPRHWYTYLALALLFVIAGVLEDLDSDHLGPNASPIFRVIFYLCHALPVIVVFVVRPRKQT